MAPMRNEQSDITRSSESKKNTHKVRNSVIFTLGSVAMSIGGIGAIYETTKNIDSIERTVDRTYPHVPIDKLKQAQAEILIFDQHVHNVVSTSDLPLDSTLFDQQKLQKARNAIQLVDQQDKILQQRQELHEKLSEDKYFMQTVLGMAGIIFTAIGISGGITSTWFSVQKLVHQKKDKSTN